MTDMFGQYKSQETKALQEINSSKYPDTNKDLEANVRRLNVFVDYVSQYLQVMQKGVDQANMDAFSKVKDTLSNFVILLGGGTIADLDFGDLQYILPALGALFGLDQDVPFPINLFYAAERFLLGYVVPLDAFYDEIVNIIVGFLAIFDINEEFLDALRDFLQEIGDLLGDTFTLFTDILGIFDIFGLGQGGDNTGGLGPLADLWHALAMLLGGFDIGVLGDLTDPIFGAAAPWIETLAKIVSAVDDFVKALSHGAFDASSLVNLALLFDPINLIEGVLDPGEGWASIITNFFEPLGLLLGPNSPLWAGNIFGLLSSLNLPFLPISHLSNKPGPNLLVEPNFDDADSIDSGFGWTWDVTTGRTLNGCAKGTASSALRQLNSSTLIPVDVDDKIRFSCWYKWASLVYTGSTPLSMCVVKYLDGVEVGSTVLAGSASPATNQATFLQLTNDYTVPAGVDAVRLAFRIAATASIGSSWWDDASASKFNTTMPQSWIFNLIPDLNDIADFLQNLVDAIISAVRRIPFVGGTIANLIDDLEDFVLGTDDTAAQAGDAYFVATMLEPQVATVQTQVVNQQNATLTNQVSGYRNKRWECRFANADTTFPEFYMTELTAFGVTAGITSGTGSGVTAHTHDFDSTTHTIETGAWSCTQGQAIGGYIGVSQGRIADTIGILARKRTNTAIDNVYMSVLKENGDGSTEEIYIEEFSAQLGWPTMAYIEFDIPDRIINQPGETYMVKVRNSSTVNTTVSMQGIWQANFAVDSAWSCTGANALKTSYTAAENVTFKAASQILPFALMAQQNESMSDKSFGDSFQRVNLSDLWKISPTSGDKLGIGPRGFVGYTGGGSGTVKGIRTQTTNSDNMRVDGTFSSTNASPYSGLIICSDEAMTNFAWLAVNDDTARIYRIVGGTGTVCTSFSTTGSNDGDWSIYYDLTTNTFRVLQADVLIPSLDWVDSGNLITHGEKNRFAGVRADASVFLITQTKSALISDFNASDWIQ